HARHARTLHTPRAVSSPLYAGWTSRVPDELCGRCSAFLRWKSLAANQRTVQVRPANALTFWIRRKYIYAALLTTGVKHLCAQ
ncbi:hypothetical protein ANANG_G00158630, partial [Anguilla anguilla]